MLNAQRIELLAASPDIDLPPISAAQAEETVRIMSAGRADLGHSKVQSWHE